MNNSLLDVTFYVPGVDGQYTSRLWAHPPRVGDEVMLAAGKLYVPDAAGKAPFRVTRVVWGVEGPRSPMQCVNISVEPLGEKL